MSITFKPMMKRPIAWVLLTALLLSIAWPGAFPWSWGGSLFLVTSVAMVGMFVMVDMIHADAKPHKGRRIFWLAYLGMGLFNLGTTWWLVNAHWSALFATVFFNGFLMAMLWTIYAWVLRLFDAKRAMWALVLGWLALEVFHEDWALSFPWLDLGNIYADKTPWVQWFQFTGHRGGVLWLLLTNRVMYLAMLSKRSGQSWWPAFKPAILLIGLPSLLSLTLLWTAEDQGLTQHVALAHPDVDPYHEKYQQSDASVAAQWKVRAMDYLETAEKPVNLMVFPETFFYEGFDERIINMINPIRQIDSIIGVYPSCNLLLGASTYAIYQPKDRTPSSRPFPSGTRYFDSFNTALHWGEGIPMRFYHKSKLVVGVETMPFAALMETYLGDLTVNMGGTTGTLGTQANRVVFSDADSLIKVAPVICWEQDYATFTRDFVAEGANLIAILTNDGWWANTSGHVAHAHYARLRAIENQRWVTRAANAGISAFINPQGEVVASRSWGEDDLFSHDVILIETQSFYTRYGDLLGRAGYWLFPFLLLSVWVRQRVRG
jgi:apolipoprotein N-acyltransferase|tara:strand:+ start:1484 stop:3121 length:1638 start_codon:yes stop_codon:yes gene_type:complete